MAKKKKNGGGSANGGSGKHSNGNNGTAAVDVTEAAPEPNLEEPEGRWDFDAGGSNDGGSKFTTPVKGTSSSTDEPAPASGCRADDVAAKGEAGKVHTYPTTPYDDIS